MADVVRDVLAARPPDGGAAVRGLSARSPSAGRRRRDKVGDLDPVITEAAEHWRLERMNVHGPPDPASGRVRVPARARHAGAR